ncbi:MAG: fluoride efflux transporter CrcB [Muribaculaceae bacterium]
MLKAALIAGAGGFIGSSCRYLMGRLTAHLTMTHFPIATLAVNVLGCLIIGILFGIAERANIVSQNMSLLLITGFCGGFTTFSTFSNEMFLMIQSRQWMHCTLYFSLSVICGLAMVWLGRIIVQQFNFSQL